MEYFTSPFRPFAWKSLGWDCTPSRLRHKYLYQAQPHITLNVKQESAADLLPLLCTQPLPRLGGELSAVLKRIDVLFSPPCWNGFYPRCLVKAQHTWDLVGFQGFHPSPDFHTQKRCPQLYQNSPNLSLWEVDHETKSKTSVCYLAGKSHKCVTQPTKLSGRGGTFPCPSSRSLRVARLVEE